MNFSALSDRTLKDIPITVLIPALTRRLAIFDEPSQLAADLHALMTTVSTETLFNRDAKRLVVTGSEYCSMDASNLTNSSWTLESLLSSGLKLSHFA
jgi:hypothetical protein